MSNDNIPQPTDDLMRAVAAALPPRGRVFPMDWRGERVWVKRAITSKRKIWHAVQSVVAAVTRLPILRPTVCAGGEAGLRAEATHLAALRARGVAVPQVHGVCADWMVISDMGTPLQDRLDGETDDRSKGELMARAAEALSVLHQNGEWHGSGMIRDMALSKSGIGFIDFEENLDGVMPLAAAQARDVLMFLLSATRYAVAGDNPLPDLLAVYAVSGPKDVIAELARLVPLARATSAVLRPFIKYLGRDARQGLSVALALETELPKLRAR